MKGLFSQHDTQDLNRVAAKGIIEKLRNIRQRINSDFIARRLIWELIQNAKDNAATCNINGDPNVIIEIELNSNNLKFSHNKGFFTNANIRGLIRRFSSSEKDREIDATSPTTTGRFGTGFMTTHLLSEIVNVEGIFQENDSTYCKFKLPLDRSGGDLKEFIQSIEQAFSSVEKSIENSKKHTISEFQNLNTKFNYELDEEGYDLANIAIDDLNNCLAYSLINILNIEKISIKQNGEVFNYGITKIAEYQSDNNLIEIIEFVSNNANSPNRHFATLIEDNTRIIIPINFSSEKVEIQTPAKKVPRLFLDFPMIGTENLNIPFVINNPFFEPTEPRDGVSLTESTDDDTELNKSILSKAFHLYNNFIDFCCSQPNWTNLYNLARIKKPEDREWINQEWFEKTLLLPIREKLLKVPIVEIVGGEKVSIDEGDAKVDFPHHTKKDIRDGIWELCNIDNYFILPLKEHIHEWYSIIWDKEYHLDLKTIIDWTEGTEDIDTLKKELIKKNINPIEWLNNLYQLIGNDKNLTLSITQNDVTIIPNQLGEFCLLKDLSIDDNIDPHLKEVLIILNDDIRVKLLHQGVTVYNHDKKEYFWYFPSKTNQGIVISNINKILKERENENLLDACDYIISLFPKNEETSKVKREKIFEFCKTVFPENYGKKREILNWNENIFKEADKHRLWSIIITISQTKNIEASSNKLKFTNKSGYLGWLNDFITFLNSNSFEHFVNHTKFAILPNQNGEYCHKDNLFLEDGDIDEELKDIADELGYKVRNSLLDKAIFLKLPDSRMITQAVVADEISKLIKPIIKDVTEREKLKEVIKKLYMWMVHNDSEAVQIFREIYEKRFLLLHDDEILDNFKKAEILDEIIGESGLTPEEMKEKIIALLNKPKSTKRINIGTSLQSSNNLYPVGSEEDIAVSLNLLDHSSERSRISISKEARQKIFETLRNNGFIFQDEFSINYTIVTGVSRPDGTPIKIVVKSAKAGKIYFNPIEWLTLSEVNAQLFVLTSGNNVKNITLNDLEENNDVFHMRFSTEQFAINTNLKAFATFFKYLKYTHFIFETPEGKADYLAEFGLNSRTPDAKTLTSDDKNLLR